MTALYVMIPIAVIVVGLAIWLFFWAVDSGQYDDMESPAHSILFDDEDPRHQAGIDEAEGRPAKERPLD
ncbi:MULTISPECIES: cbb3-type cytochrome oxidase assembly protein CcoS [Pseudomonas]|uniref:Cbb3-type cytochrome oxidase assembly protein CcoS n=1 Tax=Pseudomonas kuykendallii TaxID=1007099 RepID=A0A2W5D734_9PSED|nr:MULTISPECIES: cbb3-type cytochrome oxidase assembly protein CcoS [Pseudomonas]MCQ4269949.1 cbb3-type cytochrome oxidase assembly protein CcoS [Pseudomonas kuykendallii]PZP26103.1 MAG: cbb3-type cytochrome oxidase assembly protein CcoS [Pseudomonas kuykendallii]SDX40219.1 cytochrome oxidase maturation protein, cbb3-type [Pseudomonas kuykendallii]